MTVKVTEEEACEAYAHWHAYVEKTGVLPFENAVYWKIRRVAIAQNIRLSPDVINKIKLLASPHYVALIKAHQIRRGASVRIK